MASPQAPPRVRAPDAGSAKGRGEAEARAGPRPEDGGENTGRDPPERGECERAAGPRPAGARHLRDPLGTGSFQPAATARDTFRRPRLLGAPSRLALGTSRVTPSARAGSAAVSLRGTWGLSWAGGSPALIPALIRENSLLSVLSEGKARAGGGLGAGGGISPPLASAVTSNCRLVTSNLNYFYCKRPNYSLTLIAAERNECSRSSVLLCWVFSRGVGAELLWFVCLCRWK